MTPGSEVNGPSDIPYVAARPASARVTVASGSRGHVPTYDARGDVARLITRCGS
jgi:hypothetical protein